MMDDIAFLASRVAFVIVGGLTVTLFISWGLCYGRYLSGYARTRRLKSIYMQGVFFIDPGYTEFSRFWTVVWWIPGDIPDGLVHDKLLAEKGLIVNLPRRLRSESGVLAEFPGARIEKDFAWISEFVD